MFHFDIHADRHLLKSGLVVVLLLSEMLHCCVEMSREQGVRNGVERRVVRQESSSWLIL